MEGSASGIEPSSLFLVNSVTLVVLRVVHPGGGAIPIILIRAGEFTVPIM
jgi:hypothetical protein